MQYDVIVMGGGPGGYLAAERAGQAGLKVLLAEARTLGGTCLNEGCIPTKTLINSAKYFQHCNGGGTPYGVTCSEPRIDHGAVLSRKDTVVKRLVGGVAMQMRRNKVEVKSGTAKLTEKADGLFTVMVDGDCFQASNVVVATGSSSVIPPIPGVAEGMQTGFVETSRELLEDKTVPGHIVIAGGGVIGLELAYYYNAIGVRVTVVEMMDRIGGAIDPDVSKCLRMVYEQHGITIHTGAKVTAVAPGTLSYEQNGQSFTLPCDRVLMSLGRRPNVAGIGLETVGAVFGRALECDEQCRTNVPGLYAVGDVNGKVMLAHTAYREAECAVNTILGVEDRVDYAWIPSVIYSHPEVACAGYTSETAAAHYPDVETVQLPLQYSGRYMAENEGGSGFCKLLFDRDSETMIGAHMIGDYASELIVFCSSAMALRLTVDQMRRLVFPHPTVGEIIREAVWASRLGKRHPTPGAN